MLSKTEILNQSRKKMLIGFVIGYGFWWGSWTIISLFPQLKNLLTLHIFIIIIGLIGWAYWVLNLLRMMKINKELKQNLDKLLRNALIQKMLEENK